MDIKTKAAQLYRNRAASKLPCDANSTISRFMARLIVVPRSLDRRSLPTALQYLTRYGLLKRRPRGEWAAITCPAHKRGAETHPSLRVNLADGHFRCMACGARGGDIISLHRLITRLSFVDAVRDLGGRFHD